MKTQTPKTQAPIKLDMSKPITLEDALTVHNANHPDSRLTDITDALNIACASRLFTLLSQRVPKFAAHPGIEAELASLDPEARAMLMLLGGSLYAASDTLGMQNVDRTKLIEDIFKKPTPGYVYQTLTPVSRAMRLLKRIVVRGCLRRGEA